MLAHFLEEEGVPTTQISLIRRHTEIIKPPRALWVSFELGRPLGLPNAPALQKRVLLAALKLLEAPNGPLLEDFPEDVPASADAVTTLACPVNFVQNESDLGETDQLCAAFNREMMAMRPWYDLAVEKHGRTTVGASRIDLDALGDFICSFLTDNEPENPRDDLSLAYTLKLAADDLKAYYNEGITAQPGQESASSRVLTDWFWGETVAAEVLLAVKKVCQKSEDRLTQIIGGGLIVPSAAARRKTK